MGMGNVWCEKCSKVHKIIPNQLIKTEWGEPSTM
jgi:hypothetical protein